MFRSTHIGWKFAAEPHQLRGIRLELEHVARVRLLRMDSRGAELIDGFEVVREHVGMLVIFVEYVLLHRFGETDGVGAAEGQEKDVAVELAEASQASPERTHEPMVERMENWQCSALPSSDV